MPAEPLSPCLACGGPAKRTTAYPGKSDHATRLLKFDTIEICATCGLGVAIPRVDQTTLDEFYRSGAYWESTVGQSASQMAHERVQSKIRVSQVRPYLSGMRGLAILEIGAGHGYTIEWLGKLFPGDVARYDFIEPDPQLKDILLAKRATFEVNAIDQLDHALPNYDLIFLSHVLEHVADPLGFMTCIESRLTKAGIAYIETPHSDYRFKDDVFPHTFFFTKRAFALLGERVAVTQLVCEEFGKWGAGGRGLGALKNRLLNAAFHLSAGIRYWPAQLLLDRLIWRYNAAGPGIWLRWIVRNKL